MVHTGLEKGQNRGEASEEALREPTAAKNEECGVGGNNMEKTGSVALEMERVGGLESGAGGEGGLSDRDFEPQ